MSKQRVIIDTDPGLDDAVAILFALECGRFEVMGLTTVAGNLGIEVTTRNAGKLLTVLCRRDVPVIPGAAKPLCRQGITEAAIHGDDGLGGVVLPEPSPPLHQHATEWIAEQLRDAPSGSVHILALGPLTNIARLLRDQPDAAERVGRVIAMGGVLAERGNVGPNSEFNFACDPEATAVVLASGLDITLVPLDVTRKVRADRAYLDALRGASLAATAAADLIGAYFKEGLESRPLHDPCVMLYATNPELFKVERRHFVVDVSDGPDAGALIADPAGHQVTVLMNVDTPAALEVLKNGLA
jgi:purine nucleosidase/pyrimidine-specific ribonucleoside hydrolase